MHKRLEVKAYIVKAKPQIGLMLSAIVSIIVFRLESTLACNINLDINI